MTEQPLTGRLKVGITLMSAALFVLGLRLFALHQGPPADRFIDLTRSREMERKLLAGRGSIYDARGQRNVLALTVALKNICADPSLIAARGEIPSVAAQIAGALKVREDAVLAVLNRPDRRFVYVERFVPQEAADEIEAKQMRGVYLEDVTLRCYPHRSFLCHVLGFVNFEGIGSMGVEQYMDEYLRGSPGSVEGCVDARRHELYWLRKRVVPALEGANVFLTVDQNVQYAVERTLDEIMEQHHPKGTWAIVQRVKTGEILAMASRPQFDLNEFRRAGDSEKLNRAIGHTFEPGSVFKLVTYSAALNEGLLDADTLLDGENGAWSFAGHVLREHAGHRYGCLTVADGLKKSSNILAAKIGALYLGSDKLHAYAAAFGIGRRLGIDLPGEETGILHPVSSWSRLSPSRIAIGQGVAVTSLQMLAVVSAIANNGTLLRPHVVSRIVANDGTVLYRARSETLGRPITPETAAVMRRLLEGVTGDGGTGIRARVDGYSVGGKTGTAQKPVDGGYSSTANVATFVGFLPAEEPEIAVIVTVDEPQPLHTGGAVAAPAFSRIAGEVVRYLNIPAGGYTVARMGPLGADIP